MRRLAAALLVLLLSVVAPSRPAAAQVAGRVVEGAGRPVAGATVELWAALRRVAQTRTDPDGRFAFAAGQADGATGVRVHRMGFAPATRTLDGAAGELLFRLEPAPFTLAGINVTTRRRVCPNREDPRARALWEQVRARYDVPRRLPAIRLATDRYEARVPWEEVGVVDTLRADSAEFTSGGHGDGDGLLEGGYARRGGFGALPGWEYAPLAWGFNQHFVREVFGARHTLSFAPVRGEERVLRFCPRDRRVPGIEGTLTVGADTTLRRAQWRYRTPRPRAEAGGEVDYLPPSITAHPLLFADRALFWRRRTDRLFYFRRDVYREWEVEGASTLVPR